MNKIIERLESNVRSYCRSFPTVFAKAENARLTDVDGNTYIDFFGGAGALNYGHNNPKIQKPLIDYLTSGGPTHLLDMTTVAKVELLETMEEVLLKPRGMEYKVMFPGPTGTNAVESALKLARKATGRHEVYSFTNGFHGMTLGSLSVTGNQAKREGAGVPLPYTHRLPFENYFGDSTDSIEQLEMLLKDNSSGYDKPAAFIIETIQAEGGVNVATAQWLRSLQRLAREHDILLIVDDIQVGCGRTGTFFSFEEYGVEPDIITLSKSLSGYGLPFALVLMRPDLDVFSPGEHNGTFRGFNPAMVTARAALLEYWQDDKFTQEVRKREAYATRRMKEIGAKIGAEWRGRGMIQGIAAASGELADEITVNAFERGLIIETAGPDGEVVKLLSPLTIPEGDLQKGLDILESSVDAVVEKYRKAGKALTTLTGPEALA